MQILKLFYAISFCVEEMLLYVIKIVLHVTSEFIYLPNLGVCLMPSLCFEVGSFVPAKEL